MQLCQRFAFLHTIMNGYVLFLYWIDLTEIQ